MIDSPHEVEEVAAMLASGLDVVVVTKEESAALPDEGAPRERYRAAGLDLDDFRSLDDWAVLADHSVPRPDELGTPNLATHWST
jgi:hypothetical protein